MPVTIYHNPACSKSRKTLELIESNGVSVDIIKYLDEPPGADTVLRLAELLNLSVAGILRPNEDDTAALVSAAGSEDDAALAAALADHPRALERPIVVNATGDKAIIGRPPENVLEIL